MNREPSSLGFTVLEVAISSVLLSIVFITALSSIDTGQKASRNTMQLIDAEERVREVLHKMASELRWAGRAAEDTNGNSAVDAGEDSNGNGRFENDWALTADSITFNTRNEKGFGLPITYRKVGTDLQKTVMLTAAGNASTFTIARDVTEFNLTDTDGIIKVEIALTIKSDDGTTVHRKESVSITPRN